MKRRKRKYNKIKHAKRIWVDAEVSFKISLPLSETIFKKNRPDQKFQEIIIENLKEVRKQILKNSRVKCGTWMQNVEVKQEQQEILENSEQAAVV